MEIPEARRVGREWLVSGEGWPGAGGGCWVVGQAACGRLRSPCSLRQWLPLGVHLEMPTAMVQLGKQ